MGYASKGLGELQLSNGDIQRYTRLVHGTAGPACIKPTKGGSSPAGPGNLLRGRGTGVPIIPTPLQPGSGVQIKAAGVEEGNRLPLGVEYVEEEAWVRDEEHHEVFGGRFGK